MGINKQGLLQEGLAGGHSTGQVHFFHQARRQCIEKCAGIETVVASVQKQVLDVQEKAGPGLATDEGEKLRVGQIRVRPFEQVADVFEQEGNGDP